MTVDRWIALLRSLASSQTWTAVAAVATLFLAAATFWLAREARAARIETERRNHEVSFRAALVELATDIQLLESWQPQLQSTLPADWLKTPPTFAAMRDLLAHVWVPGVLWDRIMTTLVNLGAYVETMEAVRQQLPPDVSSPEYTNRWEHLRNLYYFTDLYLKQLACYVLTEMQRQHLDVPREWQAQRLLFDPLPWYYVAGFESAAAAAQDTDQAHMWPPYTAQAPEPDDPAYRSCALERLMERARRKSDANAAAIREGRLTVTSLDQGQEVTADSQR